MLAKNKITWFLSAIAAFVIGVILAGIGWKTVNGLKNAADVADTPVSSYEEGMWLKGKTGVVWDYYCNETEEKDGRSTEKFRWYLVLVDSPNSQGENGTRDVYIGVKVPFKDVSNYEKLMEKDPQYELTFQGKLVACTGDILRYKNEFMTEVDKMTMKKEGIKFSNYVNCPDYYIELTTTSYGNGVFWAGVVVFAIGIILLITLFVAIRRDNKPVESINTYGAPYSNPYAPNYSGTQANGQTAAGGDTTVGNDPLSNASVGVSTGFYTQDDQDELSKMLAEEDQKVANYNFQTGLSGSDRVEEDK